MHEKARICQGPLCHMNYLLNGPSTASAMSQKRHSADFILIQSAWTDWHSALFPHVPLVELKLLPHLILVSVWVGIGILRYSLKSFQ